MCNIGIVNDELSLAKIYIRLDDSSTVFSADVIGDSIIGYNSKVILICKGMGRSDRVYIISLAVTFSTKVTIAYQSIRLKFNNIFWGHINK